MDVLQQFTQILCGSFDNAAQFREMQEKGEAAFPYARHVNTPCNGKIRGLPQGFDKAGFTFETMGEVEFGALQPSRKFTPAVYTCRGGVWEGGSTSMFTPALKFTLFERFSSEMLEVSETMEMNGKRTFGYDVPILYRRAQGPAQA